MRGQDHLTFGEFVEFSARSSDKVAGMPQVVDDEAVAPLVAVDEVAAPAAVFDRDAVPLGWPKKLQHTALGDAGGTGKRLPPPFKA